MKHIALASILVAASLASAPAVAQPGAEPDPYPGAEPPPEPPPPPADQVGQPVQVQPRTIQMSYEERELILRGEIDTGQFIVGGIVGTFFAPFGIGQALQGRYSERGWIFTLGEGASIGLLIAGAINLDESDAANAMFVGGILGLVGFRIWEVVDLWVGPALHNQRVRGVYRKYGIGPYTPIYGARPYVVPTDGGGVGGLTLSF